ncbi:hypothetical protein FHE72_20775 [Rossellomorea vietnamensis]|uniref:Uncharacterized protein n=1 Tax=Rossellomorea vietnamensis TaxID=218284 RepID=A0A6I6UVL1_9BACI|nr:hypothetical protein [Rossellomorea vietnamensis]QHE63172.1 hypothetical protein FHE72_20775 [Rossellomorea vietnamensis]
MTEQWYTIGSFTFPSSWGAIIASFVLTFLFLFFWNRKASDWYSNAILIFILVWKLSVIVIDFQTVIKHPFTILYFHGGIMGYWLGLAAVLLYIFFRKVDCPSILIISWMTTVLVFEVVLHILHDDFLLAGIQSVLNLMMVYFVMIKSAGPDGRMWTGQIFVLFTLFQLFLHTLIGGFELSVIIWTYLVMMIGLIFLLTVRRKTKNE